ncbi:MAG: peroxidase-related enzyme [Chloroflexi bacterium]|nr:peroxidase-related enzyme [Chloroflexota bacterium]
MSRVSLVQVQEASGKAKEVFDDIQENFGMVPNLFKAYAHRPAILEANWQKYKAVMPGGELPRQLKEMVAVVVSQANGCQYCVNAHTAVLKMMGMSRAGVRLLVENLEAADLPADTRTVLRLAVKSTREPRAIAAAEIEQLRHLGYGDAQIVELFSVVDLFTSFNRFLDTLEVPIDFPAP